jgi:hypothetical protein
MRWVIDSTSREFKMGDREFKMGLGNSCRRSKPAQNGYRTDPPSGRATLPGQAATDHAGKFDEIC